MTELLFYHLIKRSTDEVLPKLLEKTLERGQRAVVQCASEERLRALDAHLWTYDPASFLPHALAHDPDVALEQVCLTCGDDNPNNAQIRFLIEGALPPAIPQMDRYVLLFEDYDDDIKASARVLWTEAKAKGWACTYWQENEEGRFVQKG